MSKTLSQSIQDPFDTTVFSNTTNWARYVVMVQVLMGDDGECSATLANLRETTPPSFKRFWQLHRLAPIQHSVDCSLYLFTWLGPQRLIAIIRLADSHNVIRQVIRVDNNSTWHHIGECVDRLDRNTAEAAQLRRTNHSSVEQIKLADKAAKMLSHDSVKLRKEIEQLYTRLIA